MFAGSTTTLGNAEVFTSPSRMSNRDDRITGTVFANQAGTLHVEQSPDGTNWDLDTSQAVVANTGASFSVEIVAPFWRLRYVNGATPNTVFRLKARTPSAGDS